MEQNKMAVMPMKKLVFNMPLPLMLSLLIQSLYNIVDSIFVAKISENSLTATSLAFPIASTSMILGYVISGIGQGSVSMILAIAMITFAMVEYSLINEERNKGRK